MGKWGFSECWPLFCAPFSGSVVRKSVCLAHWGLLTCGWLHVASGEIELVPTPDICGPSLLPPVSRLHAQQPLFPTPTSTRPSSASVGPSLELTGARHAPHRKVPLQPLSNSSLAAIVLVACWMRHRQMQSFSIPQVIEEKVC